MIYFLSFFLFSILKAFKPVDFNASNLTLESIESYLKNFTQQSSYSSIEIGGKYNAKNDSNYANTIAILVPYRNRLNNLKLFLYYMHPFLIRQNISYSIYLIEPKNQELKFNRALLLNVGFLESLKDNPNLDCFIFHDVDLLPENDLNIYGCNDNLPLQMAVAVSLYNYT